MAVVALLAVANVGCQTLEGAAKEGRVNKNDAWIPLLGSRALSRLSVMVLVDGRPVEAILDTGAQHTSMTTTLAAQLGLDALLVPVGDALNIGDSHGQTATGWRAELPPLVLGATTMEKLPVVVIESDTPIMLIGYDVLRHFDFVVSTKDRVVGLLPPGTAPLEGTRSVATEVTPDGSVLVMIFGDDGDAHLVAKMVVDTGASVTSVPAGPALEAGIGSQLGVRVKTVGVGSTNESRGVFTFDAFRVGSLSMGPVRALETVLDDGLLGIDVLTRSTFVLVSADVGAELRLSEPHVGQTTLEDDDPRCASLNLKDGAPCVRIKARRRPIRDVFDESSTNYRSRIQQIAGAQLGLDINVVDDTERCVQVDVAAGLAHRRVEIGIAEQPPRMIPGRHYAAVMNLNPPGQAVSMCVRLDLDAETFEAVADNLVITSVGVDDEVDPRLCKDSLCVFAAGLPLH